MILYDKEGNEKFFSFDEVRNALINYQSFFIIEEAFKKEPDIQALSFLEEISKMRRIPLSLRSSLPDSFSLRNKDLDKLEGKCKKYIPKELLKS
jgi:hypothetical protein